jgi:uncharacterized protein RhaS with RHS repeats
MVTRSHDVGKATFQGAAATASAARGGGDVPPILLLHVGERWYQPGTGRFIQRDPIGIRGGLNVYAYVSGSPVAQIDPTGTGWLRKVWEVIKETFKAVFVPAPAAAVEAAPSIALICVGSAVREKAIEGDWDAYERERERLGRGGKLDLPPEPWR